MDGFARLAQILVSMIRAPYQVSFEGRLLPRDFWGSWVCLGLSISSRRRMGGEGWRWGDRMVSGRWGMPGSSQTGHASCPVCVSCVSTLLIQKGKKWMSPTHWGASAALSRLPAHLGTQAWREASYQALPRSRQSAPPMARMRSEQEAVPHPPPSRVFASSHLIDEHKSRVQMLWWYVWPRFGWSGELP